MKFWQFTSILRHLHLISTSVWGCSFQMKVEIHNRFAHLNMLSLSLTHTHTHSHNIYFYYLFLLSHFPLYNTALKINFILVKIYFFNFLMLSYVLLYSVKVYLFSFSVYAVIIETRLLAHYSMTRENNLSPCQQREWGGKFN